MAAIKGRNTSPEIAVRRFFSSLGYKFKLHEKKLPGRPDIFLKKLHTVIFIHGCFWHRHKNCKYSTMPKSNRSFWHAKLVGNAKRDEIHKRKLKKQGLRVFTIWECQIRDKNTGAIKTNFVSKIVQRLEK